MRPKARAGIVALAAAVSIGVSAQAAPETTEMRLRGPIKITAQRAELEQREMALYRGDVKLVSPDLVLTGDRLELRQPVRGQFEARLTGRPARLTHKGAQGVPPVSASAAQIIYDSRKATVDLSGGAHLERGQDTVTSETIRYELAARRISAGAVNGGQVQIVIQSPEGVRNGKPAATGPVPAPPATPIPEPRE